MKKKHFNEVFDICHNLVVSGKETINSALALYPEYADKLRPELEAAFWLHSQRNIAQIRSGYLSASRKRLVDQIKQEDQITAAAKMPFFGLRLSVPRLVLTAIFILLSVFMFQGSAQAVSASLPGESLYNWKLAAEDVQLSLAMNDAAEADLRISFADKRAKETETLLDQGRYEDVQVAFEE